MNSEYYSNINNGRLKIYNLAIDYLQQRIVSRL